MVRRFERDGQFWEIELDGRTVVTHTGAIGSKGTFDADRYLFAGRAKTGYEDLIAERRERGFIEIVPIAAALEARDPALEAAVRANRADSAAYEAYAAWLTQHDSPLGELIELQCALEARDDPRQRARVAKIIATLGLPGEDHAQVQWRRGLWRSLRLGNELGADPLAPIAVARVVFGHPACGALEELRLGALRLDHGHRDTPAVLAEAARLRVGAGPRVARARATSGPSSPSAGTPSAMSAPWSAARFRGCNGCWSTPATTRVPTWTISRSGSPASSCRS